jgi:hypothetical protein
MVIAINLVGAVASVASLALVVISLIRSRR